MASAKDHETSGVSGLPVGYGNRAAAAAGNVPGGLCHGALGSFKGIKPAVAGVAVCCQRYTFLRPFDGDDRSVAAWLHLGSYLHHMVILGKHGPFGGDGRFSEQVQQNLAEVIRLGITAQIRIRRPFRGLLLPLVNGGAASQNQGFGGDFCQGFTIHADP